MSRNMVLPYYTFLAFIISKIISGRYRQFTILSAINKRKKRLNKITQQLLWLSILMVNIFF